MPSIISRRGKVHGLSTIVVAAEPQPPLISRTGSVFVPTFSQTAPPTSYGPVGGAQSVRDGAGARTVATPSLPYVTFTDAADLASKITANPSSTKFVYNGGSTLNWIQNVDTGSKAPKIYFPGVPGATTITGRNGGWIALTMGSGAELYGGHWTNFGPASQGPPIVHNINVTGTNVVIQDIWSSGARYSGVALALGCSNVLVSHCTLFNNGQDGYSGRGSNITVEYCNIYGNNTLGYDVGVQAGAGKLLHLSTCEFKNNWAHSNLGFGIWFDTDFINCNIHDNVSEDNSRAGIFIEAAAPSSSVKASGVNIHHNLSQNNGRSGSIGGSAPSADNYVQYRISDCICDPSSPMDFHHNIGDYVSVGSVPAQSNTFGKMLIVWDHSGSTTRHVENINLHENQFWLRGAVDQRVGGQQSGSGLNDIYHLYDQGVSFYNNDYRVASTSVSYWKWGVPTTDEPGTAKTFAEWQGFHATGEARTLI